MSFKRALVFSLVFGAGALGCHRDRDPNMASSPRSLAGAAPTAAAADYRDPSTPGPIGGDHTMTASGEQVVDPSDPSAMARDAGVGGMMDAGIKSDAGTSGGGGGGGDAGTGRTRGSGGQGSGSAGSSSN
jgi:hypothetical protein